METMTRGREVHVPTDKIVVRDAIGPVTFHGSVLVDMSWTVSTAARRGKTSRRPLRWTDMILYTVDDDNNPYQYVLQTVGRSVVYHRATGGCGKGVPATVGDLARTPRWEEYEACRDCSPSELDEMADDDNVSVEEDRFRLYKCTDVHELIGNLRDKRDGNISGLGTKLLARATVFDPSIRAAMEVERTL